MSKEKFINEFKQTRTAFLETLAGLDEREASIATNTAGGDWPTIKDIIGLIAAWEREALIADEMIKRGEESHLDSINAAEFNQAQVATRRSWPLKQVLAEFDLNYDALLMAWDEYEGEDGPAGPASWEKDQPGSLWPLIERQQEFGREIARRRGLAVSFE
ncbi:MAG: hypothetical protein J0I20_03355 [Chloroflexi bacterium]|nr:hypothetical protein [Chloroflexota bacterium]OJV89208.1 MAG: hypothetical protein BGO39_34990 [Chloroflexi bacterium 54-19]